MGEAAKEMAIVGSVFFLVKIVGSVLMVKRDGMLLFLIKIKKKINIFIFM